MTAIGLFSQPVRPVGVLGGALPVLYSGLAKAASIDTLTLAADLSVLPNDQVRDLWLRIISGAGAGQCRKILGNTRNVVANTDTFASQAVVSAGSATGPDGAPVFKVVPNAGEVNYPARGNLATQRFTGLPATPGGVTDFSLTAYFAAHGPQNYQPYIVIAAFDGAFANAAYCLIRLNPSTGGLSGKFLGTGWSDIVAPAAVLDACGMWKLTWSMRWTQQALARTQVVHNLQVSNQASVQVYTADGSSGFQYAAMQFEQRAAPSPVIRTLLAPAAGVSLATPWDVRPDATSAYEIYARTPTASGVLMQP